MCFEIAYFQKSGFLMPQPILKSKNGCIVTGSIYQGYSYFFSNLVTLIYF